MPRLNGDSRASVHSRKRDPKLIESICFSASKKRTHHGHRLESGSLLRLYVGGKIKAVHKDQANNTNACTSTEYDDADVEYLYTASQQRLCKIVKPHKAGGAGISDQSDWKYTWYMYDAGGMVMAVYDQSFRPNGSDWTMNFNLEEHDVYGSGRLGIRHGDDEGKYHQDFSATITSGLFDAFSYSGTSSAYAKEHYSRTIGLKQYEVANHLGNVLVTVSDKRLVQDNYHYTLVGLGSDYSYNADLDAYYYTPGAGLYAQTSGADGELDWYTPDVLSYSDYYAFGAPQTDRNAGDGYRYGFNGKESDDEVKGVKGSHQDYGMRMYDPRVGRFFSADPLKMQFVYYTPYQFSGNQPIWANDLDGLEPFKSNLAGLYSAANNAGLAVMKKEGLDKKVSDGVMHVDQTLVGWAIYGLGSVDYVVNSAIKLSNGDYYGFISDEMNVKAKYTAIVDMGKGYAATALSAPLKLGQ